ncbi:sigma-54-dependent Fis family transcriptional regulator [Ferrimonas balearica]|uniref:sigma 54-interacting transcriptional regulator n=1 Tax=Ferrimonas balearica TaxID=44012 RepID=UPI001C569399|nr:sigma-54-dependent Fis family transcriptional regulator [Ferrimonas balearica]MBY6108634.1 sigma-54-dependent Fis family transcriptional regulator [Ferrimonas balearica]
MNAENLTLKELLTISPTDASIRFMQERVLIFDNLVLGLLRRELIETLGVDGARRVLTRFGYAHGWRTAKMLRSAFPDWVSEGHGVEHLHRLFGFTNAVEVKLGRGVEGEPLMEGTMLHSYEAEQHLSLLGPSDESVCWTLVGFASGYESYCHGREVYFVEDCCCGSGASACHIVGRFREEWGETLDPHLPYFDLSGRNLQLEMMEQCQALQSRVESKESELALAEVGGYFSPGFVVRSPKMLRLMALARRVAQVDSSILVTGASGVGKEHISRFVHRCSPRRDQPFVTVNCGALSETLLESELFGHARGAFTGADSARAGLFEEANGGTLFLDEIGETSPAMQVKLLRALQEKEVKRVGENRVRRFDVRIIAATNRDLEAEVEAGSFRLDLLYRLKVIELDVPPLAQRGEDILPMANQFLEKFSRQMGRTLTGLSKGAINQLLGYHWPGNVRELHNAMERAVALSQSEWIEAEDLPKEVAKAEQPPATSDDMRPMKEVEREHILAVVEACDSKKQAADALQLGVATLYRKLKEYGVA